MDIFMRDFERKLDGILERLSAGLRQGAPELPKELKRRIEVQKAAAKPKAKKRQIITRESPPEVEDLLENPERYGL